jgi:hypothetical protein
MHDDAQKTALIEEVIFVIQSCADNLEDYINQDYQARDKYPSQKIKWLLAMRPVRQARELLNRLEASNV